MITDQSEHSQNCFSVSLLTYITHPPFGNRKKPVYIALKSLGFEAKSLKNKIWNLHIFTWIMTDAYTISVFYIMERIQQED